VLAIALALLGTAAIVRGSRAGAALLSALYALTHIAWHLLPGIALIGDIIASIRSRKPRFTVTLCSLAGTTAAVVLSPYFPANLKLWWVQNVGVLGMAWLPLAPDLGLGLEVLPGLPSQLVYYNSGRSSSHWRVSRSPRGRGAMRRMRMQRGPTCSRSEW